MFQSQSETESTTRLLAFLRCSILRHDRFEDLRYLSSRDMRLAELPEDVPTLSPRIIR